MDKVANRMFILIRGVKKQEDSFGRQILNGKIKYCCEVNIKEIFKMAKES